jgi:GNAT superfamily N-acetyltransferase
MIETTLESRKAVAADRSVATTTLSRAFSDDPVFEWAVPDGARRARLLADFFAVFVDAYARHDETYVVGGALGVALWAPPGVAPVAPDDEEAFGESLATILGPDAERSAEITALLEGSHPQTPCWYLQFLAVDPARQGQGLGSALLGPMLGRCDRDGVPAYLEATSPRNRALYERQGFVVVDELTLTDGPSLWTMWREPVS